MGPRAACLRIVPMRRLASHARVCDSVLAMDRDTAKTVVASDELFGLAYWPPMPAFLVSTASSAGRSHVSPFSLVTFTSYIGVSEDAETPRIIAVCIGDYDEHEEIQSSTTYRNIRETAEFVVNVPTAAMVEQVDHLGTPSEDKFASGGVTPGPSTVVAASTVAECPVNFECRLEAIDNRRWLGEIIYGRVVATQVNPELAARPPKERMRSAGPLYHQGWSHEDGTFYGLGEPIREESGA